MPDGLAVEDLSAAYGRRAVLRRVTVPPILAGRITVVAGPNGAGKSTFLRALAGLIPITGSLRLDGRELVGAGPARWAADVAFMPQALPGGLAFTVLEAVVHACRAGGRGAGSDDGATARSVAVLERLGLTPLAQVPLDRLSGGQRQLTSLAQALVRQPRLLLLDEPLSALDLRHQHAVLTVLRGLAADGMIVVAVLHDLALAAAWADRIVMIHKGAVAADGPPEETVTPSVLAEVYGVAATVRHLGDRSLSITVTGPSDVGRSRA